MNDKIETTTQKKINTFNPYFSKYFTNSGESNIAANAGIAVFNPIIEEEYPIFFIIIDNKGRDKPNPIPVAATQHNAAMIPDIFLFSRKLRNFTNCIPIDSRIIT